MLFFDGVAGQGSFGDAHDVNANADRREKTADIEAPLKRRARPIGGGSDVAKN